MPKRLFPHPGDEGGVGGLLGLRQPAAHPPGTGAGGDLIAEKYAGIRPAPGYPAQPDHTEKRTLFDLLGATEATGRAGVRSAAAVARGVRGEPPITQ